MPGITEAQLLAAGFTQDEINQAKTRVIAAAALEEEENVEKIDARDMALKAMLAVDPASILTDDFGTSSALGASQKLADKARKWSNITGKPSTFASEMDIAWDASVSAGTNHTIVTTGQAATKRFWFLGSGTVRIYVQIDQGWTSGGSTCYARLYRHRDGSLIGSVGRYKTTGTSATNLSVSRGEAYYLQGNQSIPFGGHYGLQVVQRAVAVQMYP